MTWNICVGALCAGVTGALVFDLWNWIVERAIGIRAPRWAILGRWLLHPFEPAPPSMGPAAVSFTTVEQILGMSAHYVTAIAFALALILTTGSAWLATPTVLPAIFAGLITTSFAWFIIMPLLGAGVAGARIPHPNRHRVATLISHAVMGLGFYVGAAATHMNGVFQ